MTSSLILIHYRAYASPFMIIYCIPNCCHSFKGYWLRLTLFLLLNNQYQFNLLAETSKKPLFLLHHFYLPNWNLFFEGLFQATANLIKFNSFILLLVVINRVGLKLLKTCFVVLVTTSNFTLK